jgi:hypothetical protein
VNGAESNRCPAYNAGMCAACAIAAAAGASGVKAWLQAHHLTWLNEARMRAVTIGLLVAMLAVSGIAFSGTTKPDQGKDQPAHAQQSR